MWNLGSRGPTVKLYVKFLFHKILAPLTLVVVQDSTLLSSPTAMTCGFPDGASGKEPACQCRDAGSSPGPGRSLEEGMATYSSILAWRIPWTEEPGGVTKSWAWLKWLSMHARAWTLQQTLEVTWQLLWASVQVGSWDLGLLFRRVMRQAPVLSFALGSGTLESCWVIATLALLTRWSHPCE